MRNFSKYIRLRITSRSNDSFETILRFRHVCIEINIHHIARSSHGTGCHVFAESSHESRGVRTTVPYLHVFPFAADIRETSLE